MYLFAFKWFLVLNFLLTEEHKVIVDLGLFFPSYLKGGDFNKKFKIVILNK